MQVVQITEAINGVASECIKDERNECAQVSGRARYEISHSDLGAGTWTVQPLCAAVFCSVQCAAL